MSLAIPEPPPAAQHPEPAPWQQALKAAIRDPVALCRHLQLPPQYQAAASRAAKAFPVFVPPGYLERIEPANPHDPLLRQVLPLAEEGDDRPGDRHDPVGDLAAQQTPGLLGKYAGRVLMVATGSCAVHCRYCFRRHFPYSAAPRSIEAWEPALRAIAADPSVREVILSGGDPLMLVDELLASLAGRLAAIPHVRRLRVHTRLPIMIPERVNDELLSWLRGTRLAPVMVVHANHPAEIDRHVAAALRRLVAAGIPVLNQSVLLAGVNDQAHVLAELCERLIDLGVMPYYLHQLDRVSGAAHFEVPEAIGLALMAELRRRLPGYAVPRYVREQPGEPHKTVLA
ncbi:MAG TPA: EF-P beta-lysylation protein EpmB [Pirellulales bacterium]|nr:EF-P beta-lysylation protein EpmB [Pirellulales bacterium]